jgi:7-cyano-7-deazaguanine reductase
MSCSMRFSRSEGSCPSRRRARVSAVQARSGSSEFVALGQSGSEHYAGLETFANPGVSHVELASDELTAICPVTAQPDLYVAKIEYWPGPLCVESKSLKLYLNGYRNEGHFCEALAVKIRDDVAEALELPAEKVRVTLQQKRRGGIEITATS